MGWAICSRICARILPIRPKLSTPPCGSFLTDWNRWNIRAQWAILATCTVGMIVCLALFFADRIGDRLMLGITLALSWFALIVGAAGILVTFYVKRDVES
jgi:hypothetical protein